MDWDTLKTIFGWVVPALLGALLYRWFERRPKLISFFIHSSAIALRGIPNQPVVNTHAIVLRNGGSKECTNVRVLHWVLPEFSVYPPTNYTTNTLPSGQKEIVFDRLVPKQQVTINYLYFPPLLWSQVHAGIQHDAGFALQKTVVPTPVVPTWLRNTTLFLVIVGLIFLIYLGYEVWMRIFVDVA